MNNEFTHMDNAEIAAQQSQMDDDNAAELAGALLTIEGPGPEAPIGVPRPAIDWSKPVQTVGGEKVHIYAIDHRWSKPVIGFGPSCVGVLQWAYNGAFMSNFEPSCLDIQNVPEVK